MLSLCCHFASPCGLSACFCGCFLFPFGPLCLSLEWSVCVSLSGCFASNCVHFASLCGHFASLCGHSVSICSCFIDILTTTATPYKASGPGAPDPVSDSGREGIWGALSP